MELVVAQVQGEALAVGEPHFAYQEAVVRVRVGDPAPTPVYLVDFVAVDERVLARRAVLLAADDVSQVAVLGQQGGRVRERSASTSCNSGQSGSWPSC